MCDGTSSTRDSRGSANRRTDASEWSIDPGPWSDSKSKRTRLPLPPSYAQYTLRYSTPPTVVDAPSSCAIPMHSGASWSMSMWSTKHVSPASHASCFELTSGSSESYSVGPMKKFGSIRPSYAFSDSWHVANCPFASNDSDDTLSM